VYDLNTEEKILAVNPNKVKSRAACGSTQHGREALLTPGK
jgi:hypothetical protein